MRITALKITDFKRVSSIDIDADRAIVILGGRNGAGKTTALDAIAVALMGAKAIPDEPIRRGASKGEVEVKLEGVTVTRTFTRKDDGSVASSLKIVTADGMRPTSPQTWLDSKIGDLSCDPLAFLSAKPEVQAERLRKIAGVDTTKLDARRRAIYDERTDLGRDGKREAAVLDAMPVYDSAPTALVEPAAMEPMIVAASEVLAALDAATATERVAAAAERTAAEAATVRSGADAAVKSVQAEIERIRRELARLEAEAVTRADTAASAATAEAEATTKADAARAAVIDAAPLRARLAGIEEENAAARATASQTNANARREAEATNAQVRANATRAIKAKEVADLRAAYATKTAAMEEIDAERATMLAAAAFPVDGLGFGADGGVTFRGFPLSQASGAERIRVSMGIALAANPTIRVVLVRDASLLDEESMSLVVQLAEEADAQVWLERVGSTDHGAVVINGGAVS